MALQDGYVSLRAFAREHDCRLWAVQKAIKSGRVTEGCVLRNERGFVVGIHAVNAWAEWLRNTDQSEGVKSGMEYPAAVCSTHASAPLIESAPARGQAAALIAGQASIEQAPAARLPGGDRGASAPLPDRLAVLPPAIPGAVVAPGTNPPPDRGHGSAALGVSHNAAAGELPLGSVANGAAAAGHLRARRADDGRGHARVAQGPGQRLARADHSLIADPRQDTHSWSGEAQLAWRLRSGNWRHRLIAGFRGRDRHTESGGSDFESCGSPVLGDIDPDCAEIVRPSIYSEMVWESRKRKAAALRTPCSISTCAGSLGSARAPCFSKSTRATSRRCGSIGGLASARSAGGRAIIGRAATNPRPRWCCGAIWCDPRGC